MFPAKDPASGRVPVAVVSHFMSWMITCIALSQDRSRQGAPRRECSILDPLNSCHHWLPMSVQGVNLVQPTWNNGHSVFMMGRCNAVVPSAIKQIPKRVRSWPRIVPTGATSILPIRLLTLIQLKGLHARCRLDLQT